MKKTLFDFENKTYFQLFTFTGSEFWANVLKGQVFTFYLIRSALVSLKFTNF